MSNYRDSDTLIYVSDIDGYISLDAIQHEHDLEDEWIKSEGERQEKRRAWQGVEQIKLLSNEVITTDFMADRGVTPEAWARYQAIGWRTLRNYKTWSKLEPLFLKGILENGKEYAIKRYIFLEKIPLQLAIIASYPQGIIPLLYSFFVENNTPITHASKQRVTSTISLVRKDKSLTAYKKTGIIQELIHSVVESTQGSEQISLINKNEVRKILSLTRLHFSLAEINNLNTIEISQKLQTYSSYRESPDESRVKYLRPGARFIKNWSHRHSHSILFYYPRYSREIMGRLINHVKLESNPPSLEELVNELSISYLMKGSYQGFTSQRW